MREENTLTLVLLAILPEILPAILIKILYGASQCQRSVKFALINWCVILVKVMFMRTWGKSKAENLFHTI